jgi:galactose-1-phosphate uridylyltransferase
MSLTHTYPIYFQTLIPLSLLLQERIVTENADWVVVVPYWAVWPYKTMLLPKTHVKWFADMNSKQQDSLAAIIKVLTTKYDNLFKTSFPYSMGWHGEHWMYLHLGNLKKNVKHQSDNVVSCGRSNTLNSKTEGSRKLDTTIIHDYVRTVERNNRRGGEKLLTFMYESQ